MFTYWLAFTYSVHLSPSHHLPTSAAFIISGRLLVTGYYWLLLDMTGYSLILLVITSYYWLLLVLLNYGHLNNLFTSRPVTKPYIRQSQIQHIWKYQTGKSNLSKRTSLCYLHIWVIILKTLCQKLSIS